MAAATLTDQRRIERLAARHVPGRGPVAIHLLGSGLVNRTYRAVRDGQRYSLRVAAPAGDAIGLGLDRAWECRVLRCASEAGLAPVVACCEPGAGVLVARWIEGDGWRNEDASTPEMIEKIARLARRVHALRPPRRPRIVSTAQWIEFYRRALGCPGVDSSGRERAPGRSEIDCRAQSLLDGLARDPAPGSALCHGDLHLQNLAVGAGGEPVLLDWEYAHVADPWWDLAGWACNGDLGADRRDLLLGRYLGREPGAGEAARLARLAWLYDYVCLLWCELYAIARSGALVDDAVTMRAARLSRRLRGEP